MKSIYLSLVFICVGLLSLQNLSAQHFSCGTPSPTAEQKEFLRRLGKLKSNENRTEATEGIATYFPVAVYILRKTDGTAGVSELEVMKGLAETNRQFRNIDVQFYICGGFNYVNNDTYSDFADTEEAALVAGNFQAGKINIYYASTVTSGGTSVGGYAWLPGGPETIFIKNSQANDNKTVPHEMGHYFGLLHTFEKSNDGDVLKRELVTRGVGANCTTKGDELCDTPADPYERAGGNSISSCVYTGVITDANGALYTPLVNNIMGYYSDCGNAFTAEQYTRMQGFAGSSRNYSAATCAATLPTASVLSPLSMGATGVNLSWTNVANELGYYIERSTDNTNFTAIGAVSADVTTYIDVSASSNTLYYYRIKPTNSPAQFSNVESITTTLIYCIPTYNFTCVGDAVIDDFIFTGTTNISNINTDCGNPNYTYYNALSANVTKGDVYNFTVNFNTGGSGGYFPQNVAIWVDANNDGTFDVSERLFQSNLASNQISISSSITIPLSAQSGAIRMRVRSRHRGEGIVSDPCATYNQGETEDYILNISGGTPPTINTPTSASIATNSATLGATVASDGGSAITERGIVWSVTSTNNNPLIAGTGVTKVAEGATAVSLFTKSISGLPANTNISFKGYATNAGGTAYTTVATFNTLASTNPDITVSAAEARNGAYNNITITNTGVMTLDGNITVDGTLIIQSGGKLLNPSCFVISGTGSFQLQTGGTMDVCSPVGITASGATGDVQVSGTRTFPTDATYIYKGSAAQVTGNGLPSQVQNLTIDNTNGVTLSQNVGIKRLLTLTNGNLISNGRLILLSDASGTAMIIQKTDGTNQVVGDATVQRHITGGLAVHPSAYSGPGGYHDFSSPISTNNTVSQIADNVSLALNSSYDFVNTYSGAFPNFYFYDEGRVQAAAPNNIFEKGWYSPANTTATLAPMRGFIINVGTGGSLDFTGNLFNGDLGTGVTPLNLTKGGSAANSGWHLLGNPYPAPISWTALKVLNPDTEIQADVFRRIPTGQYAGTWASFINGVGTNGATDEIAIGQGFFVRAVANNAKFKIHNSVRATSYKNPTLFRTEASEEAKKGAIKLSVGQGKFIDETAIYFENGATQGYDKAYDAEKAHFNSSPVPSIYTSSVDSKNLAINGLPEFSNEFTIPLTIYNYTKGIHTIRLSDMSYFTEYVQVYLEDKKLDVLHNLTQKPEYPFEVSNVGFQKDRFVIRFSNATTASGDLDYFTVFPNPSNGEAKLRLFSNYKGEVAITVYDMIGRVQKTLTINKNANMFETNLDLQSLINGVYVVEIIDANGKKIRKINKL